MRIFRTLFEDVALAWWIVCAFSQFLKHMFLVSVWRAGKTKTNPTADFIDSYCLPGKLCLTWEERKCSNQEHYRRSERSPVIYVC